VSSTPTSSVAGTAPPLLSRAITSIVRTIVSRAAVSGSAVPAGTVPAGKRAAIAATGSRKITVSLPAEPMLPRAGASETAGQIVDAFP
jgi:hypothetical protein